MLIESNNLAEPDTVYFLKMPAVGMSTITPQFYVKSNLPEKQIVIKNPGGKPTVMTPDTLRRLEDAFSNGATDLEACEYAKIGKTSLYEYQKRNPEYAEQKAGFKLRLNLKFRNTIANHVNDPKVAMWWLERKDPELRPSSKMDINATLKVERQQVTPEVQAAVTAYEAIRRQQIRDEARKLLTPKLNEPSTATPPAQANPAGQQS